MKAMVTFNVSTEQQIVNGARVITRIVLNEDESMHNIAPSSVSLSFPPAFIVVKLNCASTPRFPGLSDGEIPVYPIKMTFAIPNTSGNGTSIVTRLQFPITPAYSFTDYRSQGQTIPAVIVDIAPPPRGSITAFNSYVQLSRSTGASTIRLLGDFDDKLFTQHPSESLRDEDHRLDVLDIATKTWWEEMKCRGA